MATKVTLREKKISKGRLSLYLDFYPSIQNLETGKQTRREFLGLYIFQRPKNAIDKEHNKKTSLIAQSIRQKRENYLNKPEIYSDFEKEKLRLKEIGENSFIQYFQKLALKRTNSNQANWNATLKHLKNFSKEELLFKDVNESKIAELKEYLLKIKSGRNGKTRLSQNSAASYFSKIKAALKQAYKDGYLQSDLNSLISPIKSIEVRREHLTIEELNSLIKTPCTNPLMKKAAIFSALTGMAYKEIENLKWGEVNELGNDEFMILTKRQKTGKDNYLPISKQAFELLGMRRKDHEKVFDGIKYSSYHNKNMFQWIGAAGITKDITFHCFRHTYATLQLYSGTDITTVSKMLGHKFLKTTMIYAKVLDEAKKKATTKITLDL